MEKRTFEKGNLVYTVSRVVDQDPDLSYLEQDYSDCTLDEQEQYKAQDRERLEAYQRGDWCMVGVTVDIQVKTATRWAVPHTVGRASLWGIESDSDPSYFGQVESELIFEAEADLRQTRAALEAQ